MPTIIGISTFLSTKNNIFVLSETEKKAAFLDILRHLKFHAQKPYGIYS